MMLAAYRLRYSSPIGLNCFGALTAARCFSVTPLTSLLTMASLLSAGGGGGGVEQPASVRAVSSVRVIRVFTMSSFS
ncbi:hypothetical protein AK51_09175 [Serratia nematodiphila DZ0503SBS1]|nr:hypothetical protein AK51_09175 [Serratia nematodiphila DZ0503SBS1]